MVFPYWLSPDDDDRDPRLSADSGEEAGGALEWPEESDWIARRSTDECLVDRAALALAMDPLVHGRRLEVLVQNGVVILLGELSSVEAKEAAGRRVWSVDGVADVCNRLTVGEADGGEL